MRWFIIIVTILALTSCRVFKKNTNSLNHSKAHTLEKIESVKTTNLTQKLEETKDRSKTFIHNESVTKIYPTKGSTLKIEEDGSITGDIDSVVSNLKTETNQLNDLINKIGTSSNTKQDSAGKQEETAKEEVKAKTKEKKPDTGGMAITYSILALVVVIVILLWMRKK